MEIYLSMRFNSFLTFFHRPRHGKRDIGRRRYLLQFQFLRKIKLCNLLFECDGFYDSQQASCSSSKSIIFLFAGVIVVVLICIYLIVLLYWQKYIIYFIYMGCSVIFFDFLRFSTRACNIALYGLCLILR